MASVVRHEKTSLVRKQGLLELIEPRVSIAAVGGLDPLKQWFTEQGLVIRQALDALTWGFAPEDLPKGVLLTGIPGTGKSLLARAIAALWGLTLLRLDMSLVLNSLVGSSERAMRQALRLAEAMAPCLLHIDEIDTAIGGAGFDTSGVSTRLVGQLLTWLQDRGLGPDGLPAPVYVLATTNQPDRLPAPMLRPGRFDARWFVDLPNSVERRAVLRIHVAKRKQAIADDDLEEVVEQTKNYSPSEIEQLIKDGCRAAFRDRRKLTAPDLFDAIKALRPLVESREQEYESMREGARRTGARFANTDETLVGPPRRRLDAS
jgi:SpoVK/Ycf46/Vps4 family AAA+-type ATPase